MSKELDSVELARIEFEKNLEEDPNNEWLKRLISGLKLAEQALTKTQDKYYRVFIRQYSIMHNDYLNYVKAIKTNDLFHWIGYYHSTSLEKVDRIDYQEIDEETFKNEKPRTYYKGELI